MRQLSSLALGIVTAIGGFVDVGNIATAGTAGSKYGYSLIWVIALGAVAVVFMVEMVGRMTAMGDKAYADIVREKLGIKFALVPLTADLIANLLLLSAEIGGAAFALYLVTDISFRIWALVVGVGLVMVLLNARFKLLENVPSVLGLVTLSFFAAMFVLNTPWREATGETLRPQIGASGGVVGYWFIGAALLGSVFSPYMLSFYSSGGREEGWTRTKVGTNRWVAATGMGFGAVATISIVVVSAVALRSRGIEVEQLQTVGLGLVDAFGRYGVYLFAATLFLCSMGAAIEVSLSLSFETTQMMGWNYGVDRPPRDVPIFTALYLLAIAAATAFIAGAGLDPLTVTLFSMVLIALILPLAVVPFLLIMNDPTYLQDQTNHWLANVAVLAVTLLASALSLVVLPLTLLSGGG